MTEDDLLTGNADYAAAYTAVANSPRRGLVVVTCMDVRIDPLAVLGLELGDAHVLRNAGGQASDDITRGIEISQRKFGTRDIVVMHHTDCAAYGDADLETIQLGLKETIRTIAASPEVPYANRMLGFVLDIGTGRISPLR